MCVRVVSEPDVRDAPDELFNPFGEGKQAPKFEQRWGLPQRVFFPFVKPLLVADYLMPFETVRVRFTPLPHIYPHSARVRVVSCYGLRACGRRTAASGPRRCLTCSRASRTLSHPNASPRVQHAPKGLPPQSLLLCGLTAQAAAADDLEAELSSTTTPTRGAAAKKAKTTQETKTKAKTPTEETEDDEEEAEDTKGALSPRLLAHAKPEPGGGTVAKREERHGSGTVVIGLALAALIALLAIAYLGVLG